MLCKSSSIGLARPVRAAGATAVAKAKLQKQQGKDSAICGGI
jgi:hypothetical protein